MAKIIPFKGILYNTKKISGDEVMAPPYDIITPEYREILYQKSPYNIVRIEFGKEMPGDTDNNNKYTRAKNFLKQWLKDCVLIRDDKPSLYAYEIDYQLYGARKKLKGIIAIVKIEELGKGVYPHEATRPKPKEDRLNLTKSCLANISPIYSLYNSPQKITSNILNDIKDKPYISAKDKNGDIHKLYKISEESKINLITKELSDKAIYIADGHHRYEVALEFKKEMGSGPWEYVLMFLANMADEGITILPTHRLVKNLAKEEILHKLETDFNIQKLDTDSDITKTLAISGKNTFGLFWGKKKQWYVLKYKGTDLKNVNPVLKDLDVVVLHEAILKKNLGIIDVDYEMSVEETIKKINKGEFDAAFFLNPTSVGDVERVAKSGLKMPPKSTYFYPKLLTGMVIHKFDQ